MGSHCMCSSQCPTTTNVEEILTQTFILPPLNKAKIMGRCSLFAELFKFEITSTETVADLDVIALIDFKDVFVAKKTTTHNCIIAGLEQ
ncbi:hypothetical protein TNCT_523571 [Trichonephila clavata]|uniref:Uncharacterized protein n=1 Tax=Trichonephila clavata TaxID=2740835 RepID=A0A8X6HY63_TRICU|nr:hypothetical protein TNCT_523571 [Trichonephila clavata]